MEQETQYRLAQSLTAESTAIIPYLPYLLQDFWALGGEPQDIIRLLQNHVSSGEIRLVLDLACGKGAVAVQLARALPVKIKGIDLIPEFIAYATDKALEYGVAAQCEFCVADANQAVASERGYDCLIWSAVGDILGGYAATLAKLKETVRPGGYLVIDDAYVPSAAHNQALRFQQTYPDYESWLRLFQAQGLRLIAQQEATEAVEHDYEQDNRQIRRRADELIRQYPAQAQLFERYVQSQLAETADLGDNAIGILWLLQKK